MKFSAGVLAAVMLIATSAQAAGYRAPRTANGQPDLQGVWNTNFVLPLEARPDTPNLIVSEAEARVLANKLGAEGGELASFKIDGEVADLRAQMVESGMGVVRGQRRSRQVVLPADGMIPMTKRGRGQIRFVEDIIKNADEPPLPKDGPEQRPNWERCLVGQGQPPIATVTNVNPREILLTKDAVVILTEYGPDLRIIPFSDKHGPAIQRSTLGDSIARWDGDTLVIETVRLPASDVVRPLPALLVPPTATVEERYTRIADKELLYQYTVKDPAFYAGPWLAEYSLYSTQSPILEFACHEGNYSLPNILAGARAQERARP